MSHPAAAVAFAIFLWWFSTGAVFVLARRWSDDEWRAAFFATIAGILSLIGLYVSARMPDLAGMYLAFSSALLLWAWHEAMFLLGFIAGPRRFSATKGLSGAGRFREAFATVRDHELAIAATLPLIMLLTAGGSNPVGLWTFALLWVMRVSAKLCIHLGARHSLSAMMPARQKYLTTYFCTDRTTILLPVVILLASGVLFWLCGLAARADVPHSIGLTLIATLLALAVLEHLFLLLPVPDSVLWLWAAPKKTETDIKRNPGPDGPGTETVKGSGVSWT